MQSRSFYFLLALLWVAAVAWIGTNNNLAIPDEDLNEVKLRNIGHAILSASGDDSSKVLPIEKISKGEYNIRFEHEFAFSPDSMVSIVRKNLEDSFTPIMYYFQVLDCKERDIVYSFSITSHEDKNIIPCVGRSMPAACYVMRLKYEKTQVASYGWVVWMLIPFLFIPIFKIRNRKNGSKSDTLVEENPMISLGKYKIDQTERCLLFNSEKTLLSGKEYDLLQLFIAAPNQLLQREHLLKTIWEDQGVIVGRSLDVFVSKLRKKLSLDENIRLTSIHGKGYMLEVLPS